MPTPLREQIVAAAHRAGTDLVIDESFVDLPALGVAPEPPVASFDRHARVLTVGGMTKPFWGGLRIGWIRAPAPVIARLAALRVTVDTAGPVLDQLVAVRLLERSDEILPSRWAQLTEQRDALVAALRRHLPAWTVPVPPGGMSLWVELDAPVSTALAHAALTHGVRLAPGPRFGVDGTLERYVRLPFTLPSPDLVEVARLLEIAASDLDRARPAPWTTPVLVT
jgi:DNA-binding transcriptional MocR family regulator